MINGTLFQKEMKSNWVLFIIFIGVLTMYSIMIVSMFDPELGDSLRTMSENMPEVFAAFGMAEVGTTLLEFVTGYLYGILLIAFPAVFILILSNRLVAHYVSGGSMAYLLSAPVKRKKIVTSQAVFAAVCLILMAVYVVAVIWISSAVMFPDELDIKGFLRVNAGMLGLWIFLGGFCFMVSCIFNDAKLVSGINAGVVIYSLLVQMISQVGEKFEMLKYLTPLTLYQAEGLALANSSAWGTCAVLYAAGIIFIVTGIQIFSKRNLPL